MTRQGLPAATTFSGISLTTTLPAPMVVLTNSHTRTNNYAATNPDIVKL